MVCRLRSQQGFRLVGNHNYRGYHCEICKLVCVVLKWQVEMFFSMGDIHDHRILSLQIKELVVVSLQLRNWIRKVKDLTFQLTPA